MSRSETWGTSNYNQPVLTTGTIQETTEDEALSDLLGEEIKRLTPEESLNDDEQFYSAVDKLPRGLKAMQGVYQLDVSMAMDDLAWHFLNHPSDRASQQTYDGLIELEAPEPAALFKQAWDIWAPHLKAYRTRGLQGEEPHQYLKRIGVQKQIDPLNTQFWAFLEDLRPLGLLKFWATYARKYPERCTER